MKSMKSPSTDGLKTPLMESINQAFRTKTLSVSQKQAVIKMIEKKTGINDKITGRPISLLNVDTRIFSKANFCLDL